MVEQRDEVLAVAAGRGDREAFSLLVDRHKEVVYRVLFRMVGNEQDAQDLSQEAFLRCYRYVSSFRGDAAFSTWLHRLAVNTALDWLRVRQRRPLQVPLTEPAGEAESVEDTALRQEQRERTLQAIRALPPDYRQVVLLRHFHHLSYDEIAQRTGAPVRTVETRLYRARALLRDKLNAEERSERHELRAGATSVGRLLGRQTLP